MRMHGLNLFKGQGQKAMDFVKNFHEIIRIKHLRIGSQLCSGSIWYKVLGREQKDKTIYNPNLQEQVNFVITKKKSYVT